MHGKIPISKYVDESWLPDEITSKITVHHLLSHTSGLGSYFNRTYWNGSRELYRKVDDYKPLVKGDKPAFEPGKRFKYSNTGMLLLGVVIESVTGVSYFDYIRKNIYAPAGMKDSDSYEMDFPVENLAIGYSPDRNSKYGWQNNLSGRKLFGPKDKTTACQSEINHYISFRRISAGFFCAALKDWTDIVKNAIRAAPAPDRI